MTLAVACSINMVKIVIDDSGDHKDACGDINYVPRVMPQVVASLMIILICL